MSEQTFTPGPWVITKKNEIAYFSDADDQSYGMTIPIGDVFGENAGANGRLIAAATELLEALKLMVDDHFPDLPLGEQALRLEKADAAIKKATSEN